MKVLIVPDKFKGSLSAQEVCDAIREGLQQSTKCECTSIPMADGGEGTLELLMAQRGGRMITATVSDPLGRPIVAAVGIDDDEHTAFIEMASASGLVLLAPHERNPAYTSTVGTGELMKAVIAAGVNHIVLGIGGSATNDAGAGIAHAFGMKLLDKDGHVLQPIGINLSKVNLVDVSGLNFPTHISITALVDVSNPLHGEHGAASAFAAQKGADQQTIDLLDAGLVNFASILRKQLHLNADFAGAGAGGGVCVGLKILGDVNVVSGINFLMDDLVLDDYIKASDIVISGEGKLDKQSLQGKVIAGIATRCQKYDKPFFVVCGRNELAPKQYESYIKQVFCLEHTYPHNNTVVEARRLIVNIIADYFSPG